MKHIIMTVLAVLCTLPALAQDNKKLVVNETWKSTGNTKKLCYFYGEDDQLQRSRNYDRDEEGTGWNITEYAIFNYNNDGHLTDSHTQLYRMISGELTPTTINNKHYYEYNSKGLVSKITYPYGETCTRTYNEKGQYIQGDSVNGKNTFTIINEYDANGKVISTTCSSTTSTYQSANYTTTYEYNAQGQVITEYKVSPTPSTNSTTNWYKEYVYVSGSLDHIDQWVLNSDGSRNYIKYHTEYTYETAGTALRATEKKYSHAAASSTSYTAPTTWNVYVYDIVDANIYSPTLSVATANELGTATLLTIALPEGTTGNPTLHIYRNGFEIGTGVTFTPNADGVMTYSDEGLTVGEYEYFVEWEGHNISNIVAYDLQIPLPAPTNVRVTNRREVSGTDDGGDPYTDVFVTLEWDEVAHTDLAEFIGYNVYMNKKRGCENVTMGEDGTYKDPETGNTCDADGTADRKFKVNLSGQKYDDIYVVAVYDLGTAKSEVIRVYLEKQTEPEYAQGDVDQDGKVDVVDVTALVDMILGKREQTSTANVDGEGAVDVADVTALVNIILGKTAE